MNNLNINVDGEINPDDIHKVKDIDLISSFNDSGFLNDNIDVDEITNKDPLVSKNSEVRGSNSNIIGDKKGGNLLNFMTKIKENNILVRENEELKSKITNINEKSQKLLKVLEKENAQRYKKFIIFPLYKLINKIYSFF